MQMWGRMKPVCSLSLVFQDKNCITRGHCDKGQYARDLETPVRRAPLKHIFCTREGWIPIGMSVWDIINACGRRLSTCLSAEICYVFGACNALSIFRLFTMCHSRHYGFTAGWPFTQPLARRSHLLVLVIFIALWRFGGSILRAVFSSVYDREIMIPSTTLIACLGECLWLTILEPKLNMDPFFLQWE